jgi:hypothetical protein
VVYRIDVSTAASVTLSGIDPGVLVACFVVLRFCSSYCLERLHRKMDGLGREFRSCKVANRLVASLDYSLFFSFCRVAKGK